jgi:hypothetical protein
MSRWFSVVVAASLLLACSAGSDPGDGGMDTRAGDGRETVADVVPQTDVVPDASGDMGGEVAPLDVVDEEVPELTSRRFTFKGMGGVSMGACAFNFHVHHPGRLDMVAALGGYINYRYLQDFFTNMILGGFCDLELLEAHVDELNDPDVPELQCGPVSPRHPWEFSVDFNHWHYDTSGITTDRDFMFYVMEGIFTAFGNLLYYNPDHPYLPPGVPLEWVQPGKAAEKCANPVHIGKPYNYNAEYNPDGAYDLITFCDGEEPVPGGKDNPDFRQLMGAYDPTQEHDRPVTIVLAVDINGNGVRDYHEPVVINAFERYEDVGSDGCADGDEDGEGGCTGGGSGEDPNGDDYHMLDNPFGTEGNFYRDEGEPYGDHGLDGVPGTEDFGEGDGVYSQHPRFQQLLADSVIHWIDTAPQAEIDAVDVVMDGGMRDALHALTATYPVFSHLQARVPNSRDYHGYTEFEDSLYPAQKKTMLLVEKDLVDWSPEGIGKNMIVRYGNPDATEAEIKGGDGKHLGSDMDLLNRAAMMLMVPMHRWPGMDWEPCTNKVGSTHNRTFYSKALKNRYAYSYSLPPCYDDAGPEHPGFPVYIYLPGHGLTASDTIAGGVAFNILMQSGKLPKFILVVPEGQCCDVDMESQTRYCVCRNNPDDSSVRDCLDPNCEGPEESCAVIQVPKKNLKEECNGGHFFANQVSNLFGNTELAKEMRFEDLLEDLLEDLDGNFKTRAPEEHLVLP